jgi:hypothetical protein
MTVLELTNRLLHLDPDMMVVIPGYEGGVTEVNGVTEINVYLNSNQEWWRGEHGTVEIGSKTGNRVTKVLQIYGVRNRHDR